MKLLESLVALPGLALLAYLGLPGSRKRRLLQLAAAGAVYVVVALAWLTATLLVPAHDRPYAIGSTNGSAWNAAFVFNGTDRLAGKSTEPQPTVYQPGHHYPQATQSERDHIPIVPPSPTRLLARIGPLSGERLGLELLLALLLGVPALIAALLRTGAAPREASATPRLRPTTRRPPACECGARWRPGCRVDAHRDRAVQRHGPPAPPLRGGLRRRPWPRCSASAWPGPRDLRRSADAARADRAGRGARGESYYVERLLYGRPGVWWIALAGALGALAFAVLARVCPRRRRACAGAARARRRSR